MRFVWIISTSALIALLPGPAGAEPNTAEEEQILRKAGVPTDGPGLVQFLHKKAEAASNSRAIARLVEQLGDPRFRVRNRASRTLIAVGHAALPELRRALRHPDAEVVCRAERCIAAIESYRGAEAVAAAVRLLRTRRAEGACPALLEYLPWAGGDGVADDMLAALLEVGAPGGKVRPELVRALTDRSGPRRAAAALVAGRFGDAGQQEQVRRLLEDTDPGVRLRAAQGLLAAGDRRAIPALIALLTTGPLELAERGEDLLRELAGDQASIPPLGLTDSSRRACREGWESWWLARKERPEMIPIPDDLLFNPRLTARGTARRFLGRWLAGSALTGLTEVPFYWRGSLVRSREELEKTLAVVPAAWKQQGLSPVLRLQIRGTARAGEDNLGDDSGVLTTFWRPLEIHAVYVYSNVYRGSILVRVGKKGPARVVGLGTGKPPARRQAPKTP